MPRIENFQNNPPYNNVPLKDRDETESKMKIAFSDKAEEILRNEDRFRKEAVKLKIGLEVEISLLNEHFEQASEDDRDWVVRHNSDFADCELGAAQLEWRTGPVDLMKVGINGLAKEYSEKEKAIRASVAKQSCHILSSGSNPLVKVPEIKRTSSKPKYQQVPDFHNNNQKPGLKTSIGIREKVDVRDAAVISLANSIQCNLEAIDFADAIDKLNRSLMIGPMAVAIAGNARFLEGKDTGLADLRMIAWEISHDTRTAKERLEGKVTRVGLPESYYTNMRDYLRQVSDYPFILDNPDHAFEIGIGLNWRDTRIKFIDNSLVVEFRPVSVQPTTRENLAIILFYIGRLQWSILNQEPLMNMSQVLYNRNQAMNRGFSGSLLVFEGRKVVIHTTPEALEIELSRANEGLRETEMDKDQISEFLGILKERVTFRKAPSDKLAGKFYTFRKKGFTPNKSIILALNQLGGLI